MPRQPFLALITPIGDSGPVDPGYFPPGVGPGLPGGPPGIWGPTDPRPTNPIAGWNPGTGAWPTPPSPPNWSPIHPSHPIANPFPPYVDIGGPGPQPPQQPPPLVIWGPGDPRPTNPIAGMGPGGNFPAGPGQPPQPPLGMWGPNDPRPTNPIAEPPWGWGGTPPPLPLPPELPGVLPGKVEWKTAWTPATGWVVIGIPAEGTLVPTPS